MKIIGFVQYKSESSDKKWEMVLKCDSCLLNGRKPLFVPDWTNEPVVTPCIILRVSRLGKEIAPRFASRYFDAIAPGADFAAADLLRKAQAEGGSWIEAIAFDYSLAIGEWSLTSEGTKNEGTMFEWEGLSKEWLLTPEEAIAQVSRVMTIRQGDLIYIQAKQEPQPIERDQVIHATLNGEEKLYCKIK